MTANKTYLSTYFTFKASLFIKRMSLINKVNFKKCFSENYKRMCLTTRVYGIYHEEVSCKERKTKDYIDSCPMMERVV